MRGFLIATGLALGVFLGTAAAAVPPGPAEDWNGRYCTATSCAGARTAPGSAALGFGAATLGAAWLARRRRSPPQR